MLPGEMQYRKIKALLQGLILWGETEGQSTLMEATVDILFLHNGRKICLRMSFKKGKVTTIGM